jgi:hypothetical protein
MLSLCTAKADIRIGEALLDSENRDVIVLEVHSNACSTTVGSIFHAYNHAATTYLHQPLGHGKHEIHGDIRVKIRGEIGIEEGARGAYVANQGGMVLRVNLRTGNFGRNRKANAHTRATLIERAAHNWGCHLSLLQHSCGSPWKDRGAIAQGLQPSCQS